MTENEIETIIDLFKNNPIKTRFTCQFQRSVNER